MIMISNNYIYKSDQLLVFLLRKLIISILEARLMQ